MLETDSLRLWRIFRNSFLDAIGQLDNDGLSQLRSDRAERTKLYGLGKRGRDGLLSRLALPDIERFDQEYLGADGVFVAPGGWNKIYVESENVAKDSWREIERLCYLRAPLKVLITAISASHSLISEKWIRDIRAAYQWVPEYPDTVYGFLVLRLDLPGSVYEHAAVAANGELIEEWSCSGPVEAATA